MERCEGENERGIGKCKGVIPFFFDLNLAASIPREWGGGGRALLKKKKKPDSKSRALQGATLNCLHPRSGPASNPTRTPPRALSPLLLLQPPQAPPPAAAPRNWRRAGVPCSASRTSFACRNARCRPWPRGRASPHRMSWWLKEGQVELLLARQGGGDRAEGGGALYRGRGDARAQHLGERGARTRGLQGGLPRDA
jgi:hypothetical protein